MRFWQKIFFSTLLVFILVFDAAALLLTNYSYQFNLEREENNALREHNLILSSLATGVMNAEKLHAGASARPENLFAIISPLAGYYAPQGIRLALFLNEEEIYPLGAEPDRPLLQANNENTTKSSRQMIDGSRYLLVATNLSDFPDLTFIYARNIDSLDGYRREISRVFVWLNAAVLGILGLLIFWIVRRAAKPIGQLNRAAGEIADGAYEKRVHMQRRDELGELAATFNKMAASVQEHMQCLTNTAQKQQRFIDSLAHEMKTPLTSLLGYSTFLQNANSGEAERLQAAAHLQEAALRLQTLSEKLLCLTLLHSDEIAITALDPGGLLAALKQFSLSLCEKGQLRLVMENELPRLWGDADLLLSLLLNLVENAARASQAKGEIRVKAFLREDTPTITVSDNGCGMREAELAKITEPFYRVDPSRARAFGGVGLGLSICRQIAELHGATLHFQSEPGEGTCATLIFPSILELDNKSKAT